MASFITYETIADFIEECRRANVEPVLLGGAACFALGNTRGTCDIDIVIQSPVDSKINELSKRSEKFKAGTDAQGIPFFKFEDTEIDAFDPESWPHRPQYKEFLAPGGYITIKVNGTEVQVVHPTLILREKLISFEERNGGKHYTDGQDIAFLISHCKSCGFELDISKDHTNDNVNENARKGLLKYMKEDQYIEMEMENLKKVIKWE